MEYQKCSMCGRTEIESEIYDAIEGDEIQKVCKFCADVNDIVVIKRPTTEQLKEADRPLTVLERLSRAAGIKFDAEEMKARDESRKREQQINLAKLAAKKSEQQIPKLQTAQQTQQTIQKGDGVLDFRSNTMTISDLKKMKEEMFDKKEIPGDNAEEKEIQDK